MTPNPSEEHGFYCPPSPPLPIGGEGQGDEHSRASKVAVYRWRIFGKCPCCLAEWRMDIDSPDDPVASWPHPEKMTDALLCGSCQARKRVLYRGNDGRNRSLWTAADVAAMLGNIEDASLQLVPYSKRSKGEVPEGAQAPIDQIEDVLSKFRRLSVVGDAYIRSSGLDWSKYIARKTPQEAKTW